MKNCSNSTSSMRLIIGLVVTLILVAESRTTTVGFSFGHVAKWKSSSICKKERFTTELLVLGKARPQNIQYHNVLQVLPPVSNDVTTSFEKRDTKATIAKGLSTWQKSLTSIMAATVLMVGISIFGTPDIAQAAAGGGGSSRIVGEISGSGLVFKDKLLVESFNDPKINGVTLYLTSFERPLTERLSKDFFSDPSASSLTCSKSFDHITVADNIVTNTSGEEVFEESKSLLFKQLRVRRIYDKQTNTVVYVTYNTRLDKNDDSNKSRFKTSICSVSLLDSNGKAPVTADAAKVVAATATTSTEAVVAAP